MKLGERYYTDFRYWMTPEGTMATSCVLYDGDEVIGSGYAQQSRSDTYVKAVGRVIAFVRAVNAAGAPRRQLLKAFFEKSRFPVGSKGLVIPHLQEVHE